METLLNNYLFSRGIIWQQLESFDFFLKSDVKKILNVKKSDIFRSDVVFTLIFRSIKTRNAVDIRKNFEYTITPNECRLRDLTYSSILFVDLKLKVREKIFHFNNFSLCKIPLMLQSKNCILWGKDGNFLKSIKECSLDPGGYFIVRGAEKVILIQEQLVLNRIFMEKDSCGHPCVVTITGGNLSRLKNLIVLKKKKLFFRHKIFIEDIPLMIIFRYFGFENNKDLTELVGAEFENLLKYSLEENRVDGIVSRKKANNYLNRRIDERFLKKINSRFIMSSETSVNKNEYALTKLIDDNVLVNKNKQKSNLGLYYEKGVFLTIMIRRLFLTMNKSYYLDVKDYYGNKRLELAGNLIGILFDDLFNRVNKDFNKQFALILEKQYKENFFDLNRFFKSDIISNGIEIAFITGNWSIKKYRIDRSGITQVISRANQLSFLSSATKLTSSCEKMRKGIGPRALNSSQWGSICPADTPEGESCGLVKNLSLLAHISTKENLNFIKWLIQNLGSNSVISLNLDSHMSSSKLPIIFINGEFVGYHFFPSKLLYTFRFLRRMGLVGKYVSIFWDSILQHIYISTDSGRICRPFLIANSGKIKLRKKELKLTRAFGLHWKDLIRDGIIEFLDVNEENNASIASSKDKITTKTTHIELSPLVILGCCASTIPFCNHNQSPRNTYQCAMGKQSSGVVSFNQNHRTDTLLSILNYPQKPLVKTKTLNLLGIDKLPNGTNTYICVMSYSGYDLEDSIVINRESLSRGGFRTVLLRKHKILCRDIEISKNKEYLEDIDNFLGKKNPKSNNKREIERKNNLVKPENVGILRNMKETEHKTNCNVRSNWMLKKIFYTSDINGTHFVKLILRQTRTPEIGDKFSSRHGQKGVCGLISPQENLPFSANGLIPDLIMNPHGFPSRMTIGKLVEMVSGKNTLLRGNFFDGTAFCGKKISEFNKILKNIGFSSDGKEFLICGLTGEPLRQEVFCGPVYYQKLKHMVKDKIHARSRGNRSCLTRQPTEGRSKGGGLRFGEMERDCVVSFGCTELLSERLMLSSDVFIVNFDYDTGLMSSDSPKKKNVKIKLPYACKLLFQELHSMNITPKLNLKNKNSFFFDY